MAPMFLEMQRLLPTSQCFRPLPCNIRRLASRLPVTNTVRPLTLSQAAAKRLSPAASPAASYRQQNALEFLSQPGARLAGSTLLAALAGLCMCGPALAGEGVLESLQATTFIPGLVGDDPLREGFIQALLLILFSEIGDKTFFIAVLLALQQPKSAVFAGTFGALAIMTVISVALGEALHEIDNLLPSTGLPLDDLLACALLVFFGVKTLQSAAEAGEKAAEEREEAQEVVSGMGGGAASLAMVGSTFALVFAAEWGDKSFLATIALAAASSPAGVVAGAIAGHGIATVIAVLGGSVLGKYLSERVVQYVGGSLFLVFAAATAYDVFAGQS